MLDIQMINSNQRIEESVKKESKNEAHVKGLSGLQQIIHDARVMCRFLNSLKTSIPFYLKATTLKRKLLFYIVIFSITFCN